MRRRSIVLAGALLLAVLPLASSFAEEKGPRAVPVEPIKDFGVVPKGEVLHHVFEIRNEGDKPLELTDVKPACGCTVAEFDRTIAPGKVGRVKATVETISFAGPIAKSIAVFTDDTQNPKIQLVVKAEVKPYLGVTPGYARFIYVQGEPIQPITQVVWAEDKSDLEVVGVSSPYDNLKVVTREANEQERDAEHPGKQWAFEIHLDPYSPVGALRDYVEITFNHPKQKTLQIPISGFVRPRQHVTPQELDLGALESKSLPQQRILSFTNFATAGIDVKQVETGYAGLNVEVQQAGQKDGHRFELVVTVGPEMPRGDFGGTIKLHITDGQNPVVEIPFKGSIL